MRDPANDFQSEYAGGDVRLERILTLPCSDKRLQPQLQPRGQHAVWLYGKGLELADFLRHVHWRLPLKILGHFWGLKIYNKLQRDFAKDSNKQQHNGGASPTTD